MQTLLSKNPFQTAPVGLDGLIQENLAQAKSLGQSAWQSFSEAAQRATAPAEAVAAATAETLGDTKPQARASDPDYADSIAAYGFADNVPRSLINTESGGNFNAQNNEAGSGGNGHFGILQFGHGRLDDAKRAGIIPSNMTPQQFKKSRKAQVAVSNWHFNDIDKRIRSAGFDRLIGQSIGSTPISWNGMRAMAHLGGFGGLSKFINTQGQYNPADSFGTTLAAYGQTHSKY